ncbi:hypothetical protein Glove_23g50 [Diversispora epigaea]|uniref:HMG box domain-containing protein n=1 Tax=Diversispora epigaea TaxID=1348612 RepID=A0A397JSY1_9GLOM|nr:hypothetical protein Glove_23g50 [Diversispora epigaea]
MYSEEWKGKVAIDKNGRSPNASYAPLIKIIHQIPRARIFDPSISSLQLYPTTERRRGKNAPRPMNSFMILTLVVRRVASSSNVELGDGKACTKIAQLIRWGCSKRDWGIFLKLQKEFKNIHTQMFPHYDYRPKSSITSIETNFHVLSSENYGEMTLTQKKKGKTNHHHHHHHHHQQQQQQHRNSPYSLPVVQPIQQSIPTSPPYSPISPSMPEYVHPVPSNLETLDLYQLLFQSNIPEEIFRAIADQFQLIPSSVVYQPTPPSPSPSVYQPTSSSSSFPSPPSSVVYQPTSSSSSFPSPPSSVVYQPTSSSPPPSSSVVYQPTSSSSSFPSPPSPSVVYQSTSSSPSSFPSPPVYQHTSSSPSSSFPSPPVYQHTSPSPSSSFPSPPVYQHTSPPYSSFYQFNNIN